MNALTKAQNKAAASLSGDSKGLSGSSISDLFGNAAKSFVQGQIDDVFSAIGITNGGSGFIGAAVAQWLAYRQKLQQPVKPTFSSVELAKQGPVTPGTPGWLEEIAKTFKVRVPRGVVHEALDNCAIFEICRPDSRRHAGVICSGPGNSMNVIPETGYGP